MTEETVVVTVAPRAAVGGEASGSTGPSVLAEGEVALYEDVDYGGREWIVRGDTASFAATAGLDDVASSVRVGPGAAVSLYETSSFEGRRIWIDADTPSLVGSTLGNDAASSARVRASLAPGQVALYEHVGFEGREWVLTANAPNLSALDGADEHISAMRIGPSTVVEAFADAGYAGASEIFRARSVPSLVGSPIGNDTISSVRVRPLDQRALSVED